MGLVDTSRKQNEIWAYVNSRIIIIMKTILKTDITIPASSLQFGGQAAGGKDICDG